MPMGIESRKDGVATDGDLEEVKVVQLQEARANGRESEPAPGDLD